MAKAFCCQSYGSKVCVLCGYVVSAGLIVFGKAWRKGSISEDDGLVETDWMKDIACLHGKAKTPKAQKSANSMVVPPEVSWRHSVHNS
jgi:hypothetical protein